MGATGIETKIENNGATSQGKLSAAEFNKLVAAVDSLLEAAAGEGTQYSVYILNNMSGLSFAAQQGQPCTLEFTFISRYRESFDEPYRPTGETAAVTVYLKNSKNTEYTVIKQMQVMSGQKLTEDVAEYLAPGLNSIKVAARGENTELEATPVTYSVQLTSLGLTAPNFQWHTPYAADFTAPLIISGNVSKVLHLTVEGDGYHQAYETPLGTAIYTDTPYLCKVIKPSEAGVYTLSFWLSNVDGTIQTRPVTFQVMCLAKAGQEVTLLCVNAVADSLTNWQDNTVLQYSLYHGQAATASVNWRILKSGSVVYTQELDGITCGARNTLTYPMEVETDDDAPFTVTVAATAPTEEGGAQLCQPITLSVNNSLGFSATAGSVLYINPRTRNNAQGNRTAIVNESDQTLITATWQSVNWGNDGWTTDPSGNRCLKLLAGSTCEIDYRPFATESARTGKTIELDYMVDSIGDTSQPIITIAEEQTDGRVGISVSGDNLSLYSSGRKTSTTQDVPVDNGVRMRVHFTVMPDVYGEAGFNLVAIYINGKKNRQFDYQSNDYFKNSGKIILGNAYANLYLYGLRVYDSALPSEAVQKNYINLLADTTEKQAFVSANNILDAEGVNIDFDAAKALYNVFVLDVPFPSLKDPAARAANLEVYFHDHPERNFTVSQLLIDGQGTSSKKYLEWNIRAKFKAVKDAEGNKLPSITTYADGTTDKNCADIFPDKCPKTKRITAKKNWASSMQDHKAGSVTAYNDLARHLGIVNEAQQADPDVRIAVYQEPFIGFSKTVNDEGQTVYTNMGEFTMGPCKGDDNCFGYDTDAFPRLLSVEGSDNAPLGALFRVPWNTDKSYWAYHPDEEALQYNGANCWDFDAGELNADETEPLTIGEWIGVYNDVYRCSNLIAPFSGTPDQLNGQVMELRGTGLEYWIADKTSPELYNLYYYEASEGKYMPSDTGGGTVNLRTQLAAYMVADLTPFANDVLNTMFVNARVALFRDTIPAHFDMADTILHHNFTEFTAGTDQRAKNTYPYSFLTDGAKWHWRLDDADTIFPIDNQGQDRKPYWCEMHDFYDNGQPIWNGETSVFWNLLELAFADELAQGMRSMLAAMEELGGMANGTPYDKVYAFYRKYYLGVKDYFPATMVNSDAKRYELAKIQYNAGNYTNDTDPITQSHGDFYSAETAWVKKRIMYIMSKYSYGLFSASGSDTIVVRAAGDLITYNITPAYNMYPAIANGTSIVRGDRTEAGKPCIITVDLGGSADQQNAIQAASWLLDIGDWHDKNVSGTMVVRGRRLSELRIGSRTEPVTISISALTVADCAALRRIVVSNVSTLQGTLDLTASPNLHEVWAGGTSLTQIKLPEGGGLQTVEYPATNKYIILRNYPMLTAGGLLIDECDTVVTDLLVEGCPLLDSIDLISRIVAAQQSQGTAHALKHVRAVGFDAEYSSPSALDLLGNLADGTYEGLNAEGLAGDEPVPVLEGRITVRSNYYQDVVDALRAKFNRLELVMDGAPAIRFEDPVFLSFVVSELDTDGDGLVIVKEAEKVIKTDYVGTEYANVRIADYRHLHREGWGHFFNPGEAEEIYFGDNTIYNGTNTPARSSYFIDNTHIRLVDFTCADIGTITHTNFNGCTNLEIVRIGDHVKQIDHFCFSNCKKLHTVDIGTGTETIMQKAFSEDPALRTFIVRRAIPPILGTTGGTGWLTNSPDVTIYVPDNSVGVYRTEEVWKTKADSIRPLSEYVPEE